MIKNIIIEWVEGHSKTDFSVNDWKSSKTLGKLKRISRWTLISNWGELFSKWKKLVSRSVWSKSWLCPCNLYYYTLDSLWKIGLVESIQSIHNSLWTWHDKCNICCRYCIYHVEFNVCLVTKPLGVFFSETKWLNASLLFLRMNYVKNV